MPTIDAQVHRPAAAGRADIACSEPNCDVAYGGGPVQHSPHVYLVLWGPNWSSSSPAFQYLAAFYSGLGVTTDDNWSTITSEYTDGSGAPAFGTPVLAGVVQDTSTPPDPVTDGRSCFRGRWRGQLFRHHGPRRRAGRDRVAVRDVLQ